MKSLQIIIFFHARKNDSEFVFSNNLKISFFLLIHPQKWGGKINYDLWTIKKDFQIYGQRLFYSNDSVWCSFPPCVDGVTAAAAADFLGLANRLPAAGQSNRPSVWQRLFKEMEPSPSFFSANSHLGESVTQTQIWKIKKFWNFIFCHLNFVRV